MYKRNRSFAFFGAMLFLTSLVSASACSKQDEKRIKVVTTIFPQYDWVKNITKGIDDISISYLANSGIDLHSYQPSAKDIVNISTADLFIYTGGESDDWVSDALANAKNKDMKVINLLEELGENAKEEEVIEGMEEEEEEVEYDEHVWLSINNASFYAEKICEDLSLIDPENASTYASNLDSYKSELLDLNNKYVAAVNAGSKDTILFGDRFPFRYLCDDYKLNYYAAFVGCSAETEASFETIAFLASKVDELNLNVILTLESSNQKLAETIKNNTISKNQKILSLNSLQSVKKADAEAKASYLSIMNQNLEVLKEALK